MLKDNKKTPRCTCAFDQQLHCIRFMEGECNQKPIPGTFGDPNALFERTGRRLAPVAKKKPPRTRDDGPT
jgi:hypothetical protein